MSTFALPWVLFVFAIPSVAQDRPSFDATALDSLRHRRNVCPFECCQYGRWQAESDIPVYTRERDTTHIVATIRKDDSFEAISGNVYMERFGEVDILRDVIMPNEKAPRYRRGETVLLLDYLGEGFYTVWRRDSLLIDGDFFRLPSDTADVPPDHAKGVLRVEPISSWWVRVRLPDRTEGWIDMENAMVRGSDACG